MPSNSGSQAAAASSSSSSCTSTSTVSPSERASPRSSSKRAGVTAAAIKSTASAPCARAS